MPPCSGGKQCRNPLISTVSSLIVLFHLLSLFPFTFDLTFLTPRSRSAAALTPVDKEGREEVLGLLAKNCRHTHTQTAACTQLLYTHSLYHLQNICLPSNVASKASCYLDCISFLMFQLWYGSALLQRVTHPSRCSAWKSASLSCSCPNNTSVSLAVWIMKWRQMIRQNPCKHETLPKVEAVSPRLILQAITACPDFFFFFVRE